jgi:hypothetical protein
MSELNAFISLGEQITGRQLPRTPWGDIDMDQVRRDNEQRDLERMRFGRVELDGGSGNAVSDAVETDTALIYNKAAEGLAGITVLIDTEGKLSDRGIPPEGYVYAIVDPENEAVAAQYWEAVDALSAESQQPNPNQGEQNV